MDSIGNRDELMWTHAPADTGSAADERKDEDRHVSFEEDETAGSGENQEGHSDSEPPEDD